MKVVLTSAAASTIRALPPATKRRIKRALTTLAADPLGEAGKADVRKLAGHVEGPPVYRLRVGDWRVAYRLRPRMLEVVRVFPRAEGYGWMERFGY